MNAEKIKVNWSAIVNLMDDGTREKVHQMYAKCSEIAFLRRYCDIDRSFSGLVSREFGIYMPGKLTYREIVESNGGEPVEYRVKTGDGLEVMASCFSDDPDFLDMPAMFDVSADWEITATSPVDDIDLIALGNMIESDFGGSWHYSYANAVFIQEAN